MANFYGKYPVVGAGTSVTTIDGISGAVTLVGGTGITITDNAPMAGSITIASSSSGDVTIGAFGSTPNANGLSISGSQVLNMQPADSTHPGGISVADWNTFNNKQSALTFGNLTDVGTDGITIGSGTGAVIGSGTTISQHVADATHNGYLSSADWSTFNSKQASGSYITSLTGGVTASGPGSAAATVVTNANLTGPITSVGNATALAAQTGTGSVFVVQNTPTLTTPVIGAATGTSLSVSGQLTSTVSTGTAPLVVSSTTQVANLNAATAGSATTATTAINATNTAITDDTATNATMFPTWVTANTGNLPQKVSSTKLTFNPSTAALTTTTFVGALTGTASGNTTYTASNHGVVVSSSTNAMTVIGADSSTTKVLTSGGSSADPSWTAVAGTSFATQTAGTFFSGPQSGSAATPTFKALQTPVITRYTSSSGIHTLSAGVLYIKVTVVGAGAGGGSSGTGSWGASTGGGNTTWSIHSGAAILTGTGGSGGGQSSGAAGGATTVVSGTVIIRSTGGSGSGSQYEAASATCQPSGGSGGSSLHGLGGGGGYYAGAGLDGTGSGSGGGGGGNPNASASYTGAGGGAGGTVTCIFTSPAASYDYSIGAAGTGGTAGASGFAGGAGQSGLVLVEEFFQ